jgi:hypothetical protein
MKKETQPLVARKDWNTDGSLVTHQINHHLRYLFNSCSLGLQYLLPNDRIALHVILDKAHVVFLYLCLAW